MKKQDPAQAIAALFDAERTVRAIHADLEVVDPATLVPALETAVREALGHRDEDERALRLVRLAALLGQLDGEKVVDLLVDVLASEDPEARSAAGEALEELAFDRFKEVALGVERAMERLPAGSLALQELPWVLVEVSEPGVSKLLGKFLRHPDPEAVASAIEALVEIGDPQTAHLLAPLEKDGREVHLEDEDGEEGKVTLGELASEARELLSAAGGGEARR